MKSTHLLNLLVMCAVLLASAPVARIAETAQAADGTTITAAPRSFWSALSGTNLAAAQEKARDALSVSPLVSANAAPPSITAAVEGAVAIAAGQDHTCALTSAGGVKCWGGNGLGQLGDGTTTGRLTPVDVSGLSSGVAGIAAGVGHTCALTGVGGVKCWGNNSSGQLGDGTTTNRLTPVDVSGLSSGVAAIAAGGWHTCALTSVSGVKCWGQNGTGQLGDGTTTDRLTPVDVSGLGSGVTAVAVGVSYTCALTSIGGVKCWGHNGTGQLGDGTTTQRLTPVDVSGLGSGTEAIVAGGGHTCALTTAGEVRCWGRNDRGQLGDNTTTHRYTPVDVSGLGGGMEIIAAGAEHTCALTTAGWIKCWGGNGLGQLGDGTTTDRLTPVSVSGLGSDIEAIADGEWHTCALTSAGGVKCWGYNTYGQLGDGTRTIRLTPVDVVGFGSIGSLHGVAYDETTNKPMPDVSIEIIGPASRTTTTDQNGSYLFEDLPGGFYLFLAIERDYFIVSTQVVVYTGIDNVYNPIIRPACSREDLATHYAPVWYQDTDVTGADGLGGRGDYITKFDFDGDWQGINNWNNLPNYAAKAFVYYSTIETETHWFILYADFHPRDWEEGGLGGRAAAHENDMEGALVVVKKIEGDTYGEFLLMETNAHDTWRKYTNEEALQDDRDGNVEFWNSTHPELFVEARGHGVCSWTDLGFGPLGLICKHDSGVFPGGNGVVYYYTGAEAEEPADANDRDVEYELLYIKELWDLRFHTNVNDPDGELGDHPFERYGVFDGDEGLVNDAAKAPWGWEGEIFRDPAQRVLEDFSHITDAGPFSTEYECNPYEREEAVYLADFGGTLTSFDGLTYLTMPSGASDEALLLSYAPVSSYSLTNELAALTVFDLSAVVLDTGTPVSSFDEPYELTTRYSGSDVLNIDESTLGLYWWNGLDWILESTSIVDEANNTLTATPNHMTVFAILGVPQMKVFLPLVLR